MENFSEQDSLEFRIEELNEFYRLGQPRVSDQEYDSLMDELKSKFPDSVLLKKGVIESIKSSRKEKLPIPMYSLNKVKSLEEIKQWLKSNNISDHELLVITPKYDGISLVVNEYNKRAWTRGDGEFGQESKWHFNKLRGYNCDKFEMFSFGEAIMSKKNFQIYKDEFSNPRNMVAGLFNRDITTEPLKHVDYIRYGCDFDVDKSEQLLELNKINTVPVEFLCYQVCELSFELLEHLYKKWSEIYQIDGLVIDINASELREQLGREENMNPKYARAYKNPEWSGSANVKVTGVTWQVSKQGKLKPVINIEPTEVSGVTICNVTGYNASYIVDNNISENSIIKIIRSGDVIPKHIETLSFDGYELTKLQDNMMICPSCGEQVHWDETFVELVCDNPNCKDKRVAKLVHFFTTLEIEDFGEPSILAFYNKGYDTIEKIINMQQFDIISVEGFGTKSSIKLLSQFGKLRNEGVPVAKFIHALDLSDGKLGEKTIQLILDNIYDELICRSISVEDLIKIDGVAEVTARIFLNCWKLLEQYTHLPVRFSYVTTPKEVVIGDTYKGEKICFTGCRPSKEMEKFIQQEGGEVVSGVSKHTTMLVVKNMSESVLSSAKAKKAKELGIKIVEFYKL